MKMNNVYLVSFNGHYLSGQMVVVTDTKRKAFNKAKKKIEEMGLSERNKDFSTSYIIMVDTNIEHVNVLDDGDY